LGNGLCAALFFRDAGTPFGHAPMMNGGKQQGTQGDRAKMDTTDIELTASEQTLLEVIDFGVPLRNRDEKAVQSISDAAHDLMQSLLKRNGIPLVRLRFFTDPALNPSGKGRSPLQVFNTDGTRGDAVYRHGHFLKYLRYFLFGPDLPGSVIKAFRQAVSDSGPVTSGDIIPLGSCARQQARAHKLEASRAAEEFYKLALECGLEVFEARSIRSAVKRAR
jgi:hypothetical protein